MIDYIEANLGDELCLDSLARVADFSPYHFHRIFSGMMGEPLYRFIQRLRLERAAIRLSHNPKDSVTDIALDSGFSGSAAFSRAFREQFSMSPTEWRDESLKGKSKTRTMESKIGMARRKGRKDGPRSSHYINGKIHQIERSEMMKEHITKPVQVRVEDNPEKCVAYVRHVGPYKGDSRLFEDLFRRLFTWAGPRDLLRFPETEIISVYHDNPDITEENRLRTSVCVTVPRGTPVDGEIGSMIIAGGRYAMLRFELNENEYGAAWDYAYARWLPESGYQPDDNPPYELYLNDPRSHPEGKCIVDICIPVKPL